MIQMRQGANRYSPGAGPDEYISGTIYEGTTQVLMRFKLVQIGTIN